jgi:hypothetical protein
VGGAYDPMIAPREAKARRRSQVKALRDRLVAFASTLEDADNYVFSLNEKGSISVGQVQYLKRAETLIECLLMAISFEQIDRWRELPSENEVLEFKEAKNQFSTDKLLEYCVAIGNEGGGHLLLGIKNDPPRLVVGTKAVDNPTGCPKRYLTSSVFESI